MLAKMWKKVLLAICIIACIYNLMSKLVNRHSLESNLQSANDGNTVLDSIIQEKNEVEENVVVEEETNSTSEENVTQETQEQQEDTKNKVYKYTDYIITF